MNDFIHNEKIKARFIKNRVVGKVLPRDHENYTKYATKSNRPQANANLFCDAEKL